MKKFTIQTKDGVELTTAEAIHMVIVEVFNTEDAITVTVDNP